MGKILQCTFPDERGLPPTGQPGRKLKMKRRRVSFEFDERSVESVEKLEVQGRMDLVDRLAFKAMQDTGRTRGGFSLPRPTEDCYVDSKPISNEEIQRIAEQVFPIRSTYVLMGLDGKICAEVSAHKYPQETDQIGHWAGDFRRFQRTDEQNKGRVVFREVKE